MGCSTSKQTLCRNCQTPICRRRRRGRSVRKARDHAVAAGHVKRSEFAMEMIQASNMINHKTSSQIINVWELMKDLDGNDGESNSHDTSVISDFDPELIATFRNALEELPSASPKTMTSVEKQSQVTEKVIVYFTSLRGVRRTYEDCCKVLVILKSLGVRVDERDVSMDSGFKEELRELLGGIIELPRVFIGREFIGGADEIRRMEEEGRLGKLVEALSDDGEQNGGSVCDACGDIRFVVCEACSGSCKIYYEEEDIDEQEEVVNGFHKCPDCNENGLIRCPICCD